MPFVTALVLCAVLALPVCAATLFGLVDTGELYTSTNAGAAWTIRATLPISDAVGLAARTSQLDLYLATRSGSIYHSTDGGTTWAGVGVVSASDVSGFAVGPFGTVLVLTRTGTVYSSTDGGVSFTALAALASSNCVSLARGPLEQLYALTERGEVAQSTDQGSTWTSVGAVSVSNAVSLRQLENDLYVLTATGEVYRSGNFGVSWIPIAALTASGMSALVDVEGQLVAAATSGEVAVSSNGVVWTWVGAINQLSVMALGADTPQTTGVGEEEMVPRFIARAPYPNPRVGTGGATFVYTLPEPARVRVELYDVQGRLRAARPLDEVEGPGAHAINWEPAGLSPGTYVVRLLTDGGRVAKTKWTLLQ